MMTDERIKILKSRVETREFCRDEWLEMLAEIERLKMLMRIDAMTKKNLREPHDLVLLRTS